MLHPIRRLYAVLAAALLMFGATACQTGELGVTNLDDLTLSGALTAADVTASDDVTVGDDLAVTGDFAVTGALNIDGAIDLDGVITNAEDLEHIGVETHATTAFTYTAAAGGTVNLFTIGAGEEWLVRQVLIEVTTNFDATGDDAVMLIGDGNDNDGFCVLADAELQAADTEGTGWSAGWQCQAAATQGVYIDGRGAFMYDEASTETIDAFISASGNDLSAGAATAHIWYTRLP